MGGHSRGLAAMAVAVLALVGCGGSDSGGDAGASEQPYRVLITAGLSAPGVLATNSQTSVLATKASVDVINEAGGVDGRQVELTVVDDAGDPTQAVTALREAMNGDEKPDMYVTSGPSTVSAAVLPIAKQSNVLSFNIGPTPDSPDPAVYPLNFDLSPSAADHIEAFAAYMEEQGYQSVGILHSNSAYGASFGQAAEDAFGRAGFDVVGNEEYSVEALDMTPQLTALQSGDPDVLVLDAYGGPVGYVLQSKARLGWDVPILGNLSVAATGLITADPPDGMLGTPELADLEVQVFQSTVYSPDQPDEVTEMLEAMTAIGEIPSTLILAYNYDALRLVAAAAESVGSADDPQALAEAIEDPKVQEAANTALLPTYNFSEKSHSPNAQPEAYAFVTPSRLVDGQFGNPGA
jgi:branched-chain amino acid transport system substrate-binding protein